MGCVAAYDRFFIKGIKAYEKASGCFNKKSILKFASFYNENYTELEKDKKIMKIGIIEYPQMKVIDMCFWQIGLELDKEESMKKANKKK